MAKPLKLPCSLIQFLADADRTAAVLDRDGDRLAELTNGRVHRGMAEEIRALVAEVRQIEATRDRGRGGSVAPLKAEAQRLVSRISAAARWAGREDPELRERFERVRKAAPVRGVGVEALGNALGVWQAFAQAERSLAAIIDDADEIQRLRGGLSSIARSTLARTQREHELLGRRDSCISEVMSTIGAVQAARRLRESVDPTRLTRQ